MPAGVFPWLARLQQKTGVELLNRGPHWDFFINMVEHLIKERKEHPDSAKVCDRLIDRMI